jgi:hypothetical protein
MAIVINSETKLTYEDYVLFPEDGKIHEIIGGEHCMIPTPDTYHQTISRRIQFQLYEQIEVYRLKGDRYEPAGSYHEEIRYPAVAKVRLDLTRVW